MSKEEVFSKNENMLVKRQQKNYKIISAKKERSLKLVD